MFIYTLKRAGSFLLLPLLLGTTSAWAFTATEVARLAGTAGVTALGAPVAIDGDTLICGGGDIATSTGWVAVFTRTSSGAWVQQATLNPNDGMTYYTKFGTVMALSGNTAVIGAPGDSTYGTYAGAAYVFTRDSSGVWTQQTKLFAADSDAEFGSSVAIDGNIIVIGAGMEYIDAWRAGAAYVFTREGTGVWTQQAMLLADNASTDDYFGGSVAIDGSTVVIGTLGDDDNGEDTGSAYVFSRDSSGLWTQQAKLLANDGAPDDEFGSQVAIDGSTIVIATRRDDDNGENTGSAYVFSRDSSGLWTQQAKLLTSPETARQSVGGWSVALSGDIAVIGAPGDSVPSDYGSGSCFGAGYVFTRDGSGVWTQQANLYANECLGSDAFGYSVAIDGNTVVIGAPSNGGAAYVFSLVSSTSNTPPTANAGDNQTRTLDNYCSTPIPGKASDPDNDSLKYRWLEGQTVLSEGAVGAAGEAPLNLSCAVPLSVGPHTLTLEVSDDKATASDSMILTIIYPFSDFFPPVDNPPTVNTLKAGAAVPAKFSLNGYRGLDIRAAGSPTSQPMACPRANLDAIEQLVTDMTSSLHYDATTDQYIYVWKTDKTWAGTCRRFILTLTDGTVHEAYFQFQ